MNSAVVHSLDQKADRDSAREDTLWSRLRFFLLKARRMLYLLYLAVPVALTAYPCLVLLGTAAREWWFARLVRAVENAGCAAIKLAQWLSHREDFLDPELCMHLRRLRSDAPAHSAAHTRATVRDAFGMPLNDLFLEFDMAPVASGSIAQVHRAVVRPAALAELRARRDAALREIVRREGHAADVLLGTPPPPATGGRTRDNSTSDVSTTTSSSSPGSQTGLDVQRSLTASSSSMRSATGTLSTSERQTVGIGAVQAEIVALDDETERRQAHRSGGWWARLLDMGVARPSSSTNQHAQFSSVGVSRTLGDRSSEPHASLGSPPSSARGGIEVAVKVRHPGVEDVLRADISLFLFWTRALSRLPGLAWMEIPVSMGDFAASLVAQVDLATEARNLALFRRNFAHRDIAVTFPRPLPELVSSTVLAESWESGQPIQSLIDDPSQRTANEGLAQTGYRTFMTMMLLDNFMHADCHAGNLLVCGDGDGRRRTLVVLDAGLVTELTPAAMTHFKSLLLHVATGRGADCADMFLTLAERRPPPARAAAFRAEMEALFHRRCDDVGGTHALLVHGPTLRGLTNARTMPPLNVGVLINDVMALVRRHGLLLESEFALTVVSLSVLEGLARALDPKIDLVGGMVPFFASELRDRANYALRRLAADSPVPA